MSGAPATSIVAITDTVPVAEQVASAAPVIVDEAGRVEGSGPEGSLEAPGGETPDRGSRVAVRGGRGGGVQPAVAARTSRATPRQAVDELRGAVPARLASTTPVPSADPAYDRDIATLRKIVGERRAQLDPATVAVLEQSVAVIDSAIAQSRAALARDPASRFLATQLDHSLGKKIELLRTAAMLPART